MRKICFYTGGRAEYGLLYWIMKEVLEDPELKFHLVVSGAHFDKAQGNSIDTVKKDGFPISKEIHMLSDDRSPKGLTKAMGKSLTLLADALEEIKPDIGVILGDRYEILTFAQACMMQNIPVAHIHGGESTEGVVDELIRHAVTKISHLHFPSTETYRNRIIQLGESPERVFNLGAPGIEGIKRTSLKLKEFLFRELDIPLKRYNLLVTYHPVTLYPQNSKIEFESILKALQLFLIDIPDTNIIFTMPNIENGSIEIMNAINLFSSGNENVFTFSTLGQTNYISMLKNCDAVIGNSSSGIVEAPFLRVPTVNVGERQNGRLKGETIIDIEPEPSLVLNAIKKAIDPLFIHKIKNHKCIYGNGNTSKDFKEIIKSFPLDKLLYKKFFDIDIGTGGI